jgi:predicted RNase H-like nuclease
MRTRLIGIDCATEDKKIGLAFAVYDEGVLRVDDLLLWEKDRQSIAGQIAAWVREGNGSVLIAMDAPLGWPLPLTLALADHRAGSDLNRSANEMFRRTTDNFIQEKLGQRSLDVGADRIARTAHAALRLLGELRRDLGTPIPLAWDATFTDPIAAIEVYPAATLVAHGLRSSGYKKPDQSEERKQIIESLRALIALPDDIAPLEANADALDAVICLLAAIDFIDGHSLPPDDSELAAREGWIWVRGG